MLYSVSVEKIIQSTFALISAQDYIYECVMAKHTHDLTLSAYIETLVFLSAEE